MTDQVVANQTVADSAEKVLVKALKDIGINLMLIRLCVPPKSPLGYFLTQLFTIVIDQGIDPVLKELARNVNIAIINTNVDGQVDAVKKAITLKEAVDAFEKLS